MTPKEKAIKLCQDMAYTSMKTDFNEGYTLPLEIAKKCALIAVDETLKIGTMINDLPLSETKIIMEAYPKFWKEVKTEIEKL
jgi:predicted proteasome-type protease